MKIIYYDCFAGISGDMNLAAMLDLGVPLEYLKSELKKLSIDEYTLEAKKSLKMGISGTQVDVNLSTGFLVTVPDNFTGHLHGHSHGHSHNNRLENKSKQHEHRSYDDIKKIIIQSELSDEVKKTSIEIFEKVAVAEGKIHNKPVDEVHFHEVGAVDSIVDIVGAAICYHYLKPDKVLCSTVELGGGFVQCAHGKFPVPAPATLEILKDIPVRKGTVNFETTTPTGAAILVTLVNEFTDKPEFNVSKTAYGLGHRDMEIPNVLRVNIAETDAQSDTETALIIECNIDDMSPEYYEYIIDKLLNAGAHDVYLTPIVMKKSRPANKLSVLCFMGDRIKMESILFSETTTLGVRSFPVQKKMMKRKTEFIQTKYGPIEVKIGFSDEIEAKIKPEYEQCRVAAVKYNVPLKDVIDEVLQIMIKQKNG